MLPPTQPMDAPSDMSQRVPEHAENPLNFRELTVVDYVAAFVKRWKLFVAILVITLIGAIVVFYHKTHTMQPYPYETVIEVGRYADGTPIESMEVVRTRLQDAYIPRVLKEYALAHGQNALYNVAVIIPTKDDGSALPTQAPVAAVTTEGGRTNAHLTSTLVVLKSYGNESDKNAILAIHQAIVDQLLRDHDQKAERIKRDLIEQQSQAQFKLDELKARAVLFVRKREAINQSAVSIRKQIERMDTLVEILAKDRAAALAQARTRGSFDQTLATGLLFIDPEMTKGHATILVLEDKLRATLITDRDRVDEEEFTNTRTLKEQEILVASLSARANNIEKTISIVPPSQFLKEPRKSPVQSVVILLIIGLALAIAVVLLLELIMNAHKQLQKQER